MYIEWLGHLSGLGNSELFSTDISRCIVLILLKYKQLIRWICTICQYWLTIFCGFIVNDKYLNTTLQLYLAKFVLQLLKSYSLWILSILGYPFTQDWQSNKFVKTNKQTGNRKQSKRTVLRSAKRAPANVRRLNNRKWRQRYCSVGECSRALALLNAALVFWDF